MTGVSLSGERSEFLFLPPLFLGVTSGFWVLLAPITHLSRGPTCSELPVCEEGREEFFALLSLGEGCRFSGVLTVGLEWSLLCLEGCECGLMEWVTTDVISRGFPGGGVVLLRETKYLEVR